MHVGPGFSSHIAYAGLDIEPAIGFDNKQSVKADGAAGIASQSDADPAHLRSVAFAGAYFQFVPFELLGPAVQRFLDECAGGILLLARCERSERSLAGRSVEAAQSHLIDAEFPRGLRQYRFHKRGTLHPAGRTL